MCRGPRRRCRCCRRSNRRTFRHRPLYTDLSLHHLNILHSRSPLPLPPCYNLHPQGRVPPRCLLPCVFNRHYIHPLDDKAFLWFSHRHHPPLWLSKEVLPVPRGHLVLVGAVCSLSDLARHVGSNPNFRGHVEQPRDRNVRRRCRQYSCRADAVVLHLHHLHLEWQHPVTLLALRVGWRYNCCFLLGKSHNESRSPCCLFHFLGTSPRRCCCGRVNR